MRDTRGPTGFLSSASVSLYGVSARLAVRLLLPLALLAACQPNESKQPADASEAPDSASDEDGNDDAQADGELDSGAVGADAEANDAGQDAARADAARADAAECESCAGTCKAGHCVVQLATQQVYPNEIVVDATFVYWANLTGNALVKVNKAGGDLVQLATGQALPGALAIDERSVYWSNSTRYTLMSLPLDGGTPTTLIPTGGVDPVLKILPHGDDLYWISSNAAIRKIPRTGGSNVSLVSGDMSKGGSRAFAFYDDKLYWIQTTGGAPNKVAALMRLSLPDGAPERLAMGAWDISGNLAMDATRIYWTVSEALMSAALDGTDIKVEVSKHQATSGSIALDADHVYWADIGKIMTMSRRGGEPTAVVETSNDLTDIALDETSLYWSSGNASGAIWKVTPK